MPRKRPKLQNVPEKHGMEVMHAKHKGSEQRTHEMAKPDGTKDKCKVGSVSVCFLSAQIVPVLQGSVRASSTCHAPWIWLAEPVLI
jgi:hypothetical protein